MSLLGFIRNKILGDDDKNKPQAQPAQQPPKPQAYKPSLREEMQNYARSGKWDNNAAANILNQGLDSGFSWEKISQETGVGLDDIRNFSRATRPDYGIKIERPDQSFGNKIVDIFSANTDADKYRRAMKGDAGLTINDFVNNQLTDKTPVGDTVNMFSGEKGPQQVSVQDLSDNFSRMDKATKRAYVSNALAASQRGDFDAKETLRALASKGQLNEDATNISSNPLVNAGRAFTGGVVGGTGAIAQGFAQTPGINTLTPLFLWGNDNPREALKESIDMTRRVGAETRLANASGVGKGINLAGEMAPTVALTALTGPVGKIPFGAVPKAATNLATNIPKALAGSYPVLPKIAPFVPGASSTMALTAGFGQGTGSIYNSLTDMGVENNRARLGAITGGALSAVPTALGIKGILNPVGIAKPVVNKFGSKAMQKGMERLANGEMNAAASFLARRSLQAPVELGVGAANQIGNNIGLNVGGVPTNIFQGVPQAAKENALISMAMGSAGELGSAGGKVLVNKAKVVDVNAKKVGGYTNYLDLRKDNKIQELLHLDRQYAKTLDTAYLTPKGRRDIMKAQVALHKEISDRVDELKKGSGTMLGSGPVPNFGRSKYLHAKDALAKSEGQSKVGKVTVKANQSEPLPADVQEVVSAIHDSINKGDYTQAKILKESMGEYAPNIDIPSVAPPKDNSIGSILKERQQVKVQTNKTQELSKRYGVTERTIQTLQKRYGEDNTNNILASTSDATNIRDMNHFVLGEARKRFSNNKGVVVKNNQAPDIQTSPEELASLAKTAPVQETDGTQERSVKVVDKSKPIELDKSPERPAEVSGVTGEVRLIHQQIKELPSHENLTAKGAAEVESFNDNFNKHLLEVEKRVGTAKLQKMADDIFNSKNGKFPDPSKIPADSKALYNKEFKQVFEEMAEGRRSAGGTIHEYYFPETIETGGPLVDMGYGLIHKGDVETYGSNIERKGTAKLENLADPITRLRQAKDQFLADKYGGTKEYEIHRTAKAVTERLQRNTQETGETNITKDLGKSKAGDIKINKAINKSAEMIHNLKERIDNQAWDIGAAGFGKRKIINKESRTSIDSANELFSIGKQLGRKQVEINTRSRTSDITVAQKLDDIKVNNESLMRAGGYGQFRDADAFAGTHIKASLNKNGKLNITRLRKDVRKYLTENYKMSKTDVDYLVKSVGDINGKSSKNLPQEILQSKLSSIYQEAARAQMIDLLQTTKFTNKKVNHMVSELTNQILATNKIDSTTANTVVKNVLKTQNTLFRRGNVGSAMNEFSDIPSMLGAFGKDLKIGYDKKMLKVLGVDGHLDPSTEAILQTVTDNKSAQKAFVKLAQKGASGLDFYKYVEALKASTVLKTSQAYWSKKGYKGDALTTKMLHDYRELTLPIDMFTKTALDSVPLYTQYQSWQLRNTQKEFNLARGTLDVGKYTDASRTERIIRNAALNIPAKTAFWLASNGLKGTAIITAFGLTDYTGLTDQDFSGIDDKDKSVWDKTGGKLADLTTTGSLLNSVYQTYEKEKLKKQYENAEYNPYHNNNLASDTLSRFTPQQIKNISGMQETRDKKYSTNRDGKVQYLEATNPLDVARGYVFGKRNTQAGRDYTGNKDVITRVKEGKNPVVAVRDMAKEQLGAQDKIYNRPLNNSDYANYSGKVKELMKKGDTQGAKAMFDGGRAYNHTLDDLMRKDKSAYNHYISSLANDVVPPEKWRERVIRDGKVDYTIYDMLKKREVQRVKDMGGDLNPLYDGKLTKPQLADLLSDKATETGKDIASRNLLWKEKWYQDYKAREKEFYNKNPYADGRALKGRQKDWQDLEDFRNTLSQVRDSKTGKEMAWVKDYPLVAQYKDLNDQYGFNSPEVKSFFKNNYDDYKTQRDTKNAVELATINKMRGIEGHEPMSDSQFAQAKNVVQEDKTAKSNTSSGGGKKYYGSSSSSRGYLSNNFVGTIKGDLGPVAKLKYSSGGKVSIKARATPKVASVKRQKARM